MDNNGNNNGNQAGDVFLAVYLANQINRDGRVNAYIAQGMTAEQARAQYLLDFPPRPPLLSSRGWDGVGLLVWTPITAFWGWTEVETFEPGYGQPIMGWLVAVFGGIFAFCLWRLSKRLRGLLSGSR
jgi:hypothetical protein